MEFERIYQELVESTQMIRTLVQGVTQAEACLKPDPESWSFLEVICHLYDIEREDFRQRLDSILYRPMEEFSLIDPQSWIKDRGYNQRDFAGVVQDFFMEREKSLAWLRSLPNPDWEAEYVDESGPTKAGTMLVSWAAHDNLHIRQLVELRRVRIVSMARPFDVDYAGEW
jgi:hypothetical protein